MNKDFPLNHFLKLEETAKNIHAQEHISTLNDVEKLEKEAPKQSLESKDGDVFSLEELDSIKDEILNYLKSLINTQKFHAFFSNTFTVKSFGQDEIVFSVTTNFIKKMIELHYKNQLSQALENAFGNTISYKIEVADNKETLSSNDDNLLKKIKTDENHFHEPYSTKKGQKASDISFKINNLTPSKEDLLSQVDSKFISHIEKKGFESKLDRKKTFQNFVVGPSNNMAHAASLSVAKNPGKIYPCLYFHGNSGLGKTHLIHAVANFISEHTPQLRLHITTANEFMNEMVNCIKNKNIESFRKKYSEQIDVLLIDDIHELKNRQYTQNEFFHVFNELYQKNKQLIFTSDKHPKEIDGLEERIKTRLTWGLVLEVQQPDLETRIAILQKKAMDIDIYLPDDVVNMIANCVKSNIRELEGSLIKLGAYSSLFKVDIDLETAKEQLKLTDEVESKILTLESIAKTVSQHLKIPVADMRGKSRIKNVTKARHIAMYFSHFIMKATLTEIGNFYGKRDHTTVLYAVNRLKKEISKDESISQLVYEIESQL